MNLSSFEHDIDEIVVERGWDYYSSGYVGDIQEVDEGRFSAIVKGNEDYLVWATIDSQGNIKQTECNCPYDWGPYCKHQVALFYALRQGGNSGDLTELLMAQSKDDLVQFIEKLIHEDPKLRQRLLVEFGTPDEDTVDTLALIQGYIDHYADRDGFVSWNQTGLAVQGAEIVLDRARGLMDEGRYLEAAKDCLIILAEMSSLQWRVDDSSGSVGEVINATLEALVDLTDQPIPEPQAQTIFNLLMAESEDPRYEDWSERVVQLWRACSKLVDDPQRRRVFVEVLESELEGSGPSWGDRYRAEQVGLILLDLKDRYEDSAKAMEFMLSHSHLPSLRERAIWEYISQGQYPEAESLAVLGEEKDCGYAGLLLRWQRLRLEIYLAWGRSELAKEQAYRIAVTGNVEDYRRLKGLYADEWSDIYPLFIERLKSNPHPEHYQKILVEEGDLERLLDYTRLHTRAILDHGRHLLPRYRQAVYDIYGQLIKEEGQLARNRQQYREVCSILDELYQLGGVAQSGVIAAELRQTYAKRPAFLDELRKVGF